MNMVATPDLPEGIINQPCNIEYRGKQNKDYVASYFLTAEKNNKAKINSKN